MNKKEATKIIGEIQLLHQPTGVVRLGDFLLQQFSIPIWTEFQAAVAFVKRSGMKHFSGALHDFAHRARVRICVGIDCGGTSFEGLRELINCVNKEGELFAFHNENTSTFHPKVYLFRNEEKAIVVVGSGNLTEGGLFTNYEAGLALSLVLHEDANREFVGKVERMLSGWCDESTGMSKRLDVAVLEDLKANGYVVEEGRTVPGDVEEGTRIGRRREKAQTMFSRCPVRRAPRPPEQRVDVQVQVPQIDSSSESQTLAATGFVMTLQRTDVGTGQISPDTSRRSPEIFVPLAARDQDPDFWGWPAKFSPDPIKAGKMDRRGVTMKLGTEVIEVNMMTWPDKHDFRLRNERLRSAGNIGDLLRVEKTVKEQGFEYYVEIIPQGTSQYQNYLSVCVNSVRNSDKRWGYYI